MTVAGPFVEAGLLRGERCLCVLTRKQTDQLCSALRASGINPQHEVSRGALLFSSPKEAYLKGGRFERGAMIQLLNAALQEYETMLDSYYPGTKSLRICMYDMRLFGAEH